MKSLVQMVNNIPLLLMRSNVQNSSYDQIRERENRWAEVRKKNNEVFQRQLERYAKDPDGYSKMKGWEE